MKIGTKSVLFGAHAFFLHPWFVAWAWWKLYGFRQIYIGYNTGHPQTATGRTRLAWRLGFRGGPRFASLWHPALWLAFIVHDLGYFGKPNMDGLEGEQHPEFGARIVGALFGDGWYRFTRYHSRYLAKKDSRHFSALCLADKLAIAITPAWLYLPMVTATGEIDEYLQKAAVFQRTGEGAASGLSIDAVDPAKWYADVQAYCRKWVEEHKDGRTDGWTPATREEPIQ